jgi:hypothetical protein
MHSQQQTTTGVSRRQWMLGTGALATTAALTHLSGWLPSARATGGTTEKWPWPYEKLDPTTTAELAYKEWYRVFCGCAVISSVFTQLREKVGEPYTSFPIDAFVFLEGGVASWGTICGSNAGANIVANLIIGPRIAGAEAGHQIGTDVMQWYCESALPVFKPKDPTDHQRITALSCLGGQVDGSGRQTGRQPGTKRPLCAGDSQCGLSSGGVAQYLEGRKIRRGGGLDPNLGSRHQRPAQLHGMPWRRSSRGARGKKLKMLG